LKCFIFEVFVNCKFFSVLLFDRLFCLWDLYPNILYIIYTNMWMVRSPLCPFSPSRVIILLLQISFIYLLISFWVGVHFDIYKSSYNVSKTLQIVLTNILQKSSYKYQTHTWIHLIKSILIVNFLAAVLRDFLWFIDQVPGNMRERKIWSF
jgi:hypothetical protein